MPPFDADHPCEMCVHTYEEHLGERGSCTGTVILFGRETICACVEFEPVETSYA